MQELEKILEEIDQEKKNAALSIRHTTGYKAGQIRMAERIEEIIRKHMNDGWISVEERLPENSKHKGSFCPRYLIDTKYGVTEGWYNSDVESWYCLFWFMTMRYLEHEIDFEKGDVPKVIRVTLESDIVIAWKPLPEPYRPERSGEE